MSRQMRGIADLAALAGVMPAHGFLFGPRPASIDAAVYGSLANIFYFDIDTPLKRFVESHQSVVRHTEAMHAIVTK